MSNNKKTRLYPLSALHPGEVYLTHSGDRQLVAELYDDSALLVQLGVSPVQAARLTDGELGLVLAGASLLESGFAPPASTHVIVAMQPRSSIAVHSGIRSAMTGPTTVRTYLLRRADGVSLTVGSGNPTPWPGALEYTDTVELLAVGVPDEQLRVLAVRGADVLVGELAKAQTRKITLGDLLQEQRSST